MSNTRATVRVSKRSTTPRVLSISFSVRFWFFFLFAYRRVFLFDAIEFVPRVVNTYVIGLAITMFASVTHDNRISSAHRRFLIFVQWRNDMSKMSTTVDLSFQTGRTLSSWLLCSVYTVDGYGPVERTDGLDFGKWVCRRQVERNPIFSIK